MYQIMAVFAALIGLAVTGAAVYTAYFVWRLQMRTDGTETGKSSGNQQPATKEPAIKQPATKRPDNKQPATKQPDAILLDAKLLLRWTVLDYSLIGLVLIGFLFLLADVLGVVRDRAEYSFYHYGYLLSGFVFTFVGVLFLLARLMLLLRIADAPRLGAPDHHDKPDRADHTE